MSALTLRLREAPPERLDFSGVSAEALNALSEAEIAGLPVGTTRLGVRLGDCFAVTRGDGPDLRIEGGSPRLDNVGAGLRRGTVHVEGDVGQRLGLKMKGGEIRVSGSAGPFAASGAAGGLVIVAGDADERAGGALHGAMAGLDGATLVVRGRAGAWLGDRMRGGLIVAEHAGDYAGARMIAGTLVAGTVGDYPGYAMRRGTLLVGGHGVPVPSFVDTGTHRLVFVRLLRRAVSSFAPHLADLARDDLNRRAGDLATLGKGELLTPRG
jgi:formylmethanofuran dehydrogenase subunit C